MGGGYHYKHTHVDGHVIFVILEEEKNLKEEKS
jgi:hypothetical protein